MTPADTMRAAVEALTDEEIDAIFCKHHNPQQPAWVNWRRFARAVLASIPPNTPVEAGKVGVAAGVAIPAPGSAAAPFGMEPDDHEYDELGLPDPDGVMASDGGQR